MYCEIKNALSKKQVNELISAGESSEFQQTSEEGKPNHAYSGRSPGTSLRATINSNTIEWLKKRLQELAEKAVWKFLTEEGISIDISGGVEGKGLGTFSIYNEGDYYTWHKDTNPRSRNRVARTRSLSIVIQLSEAKDYENGELLLKIHNKTITTSKKLGDAIIFTGDTLHSVAKITKGTRKSLIFWFHKK